MQYFIKDVNHAISNIMKNQSYMIVVVHCNEIIDIKFKKILENNRILKFLKIMTCLDIVENTEEYEFFSDTFVIHQIPAICIIDYEGEIVDCFYENCTIDQLELRLNSLFNVKSEPPVDVQFVDEENIPEIPPNKQVYTRYEKHETIGIDNEKKQVENKIYKRQDISRFKINRNIKKGFVFLVGLLAIYFVFKLNIF